MSSSFTVRSAAGVLVSLLHPVDIGPTNPLDDAPEPYSNDSSESGSPKKRCICGECGRSFSTMGHLNRHLTLHTGGKEHVCPSPGCGKSASRRDNLVQHYRMHLPNDEHKRCTTYVRSKMEEKMGEVGVWPVQQPRGRKGVQASRPVGSGYDIPSPRLTAHRVTPPTSRNPMYSESSLSRSPTPTTSERALTESSNSAISSSPLLTPTEPLTVPYAEHNRYHPLRHGNYYAGPSVYQQSACVPDYLRNLPVSNAREE